MNQNDDEERLVVQLAAERERNLDQPDLESTAAIAWATWAPMEALLELPREAEDLIDEASLRLGYLADGARSYARAWERAEAATWGRRPPAAWRPLHLGDFRRKWTRRGLLHAAGELVRQRGRPSRGRR